MADAEKNTEEMLEGALGGAVFFDEMHTLHETGYCQGDPYGNAIINTLLLYMENHREELVVFGAGYAKATEKMLAVSSDAAVAAVASDPPVGVTARGA